MYKYVLIDKHYKYVLTDKHWKMGTVRSKKFYHKRYIWDAKEEPSQTIFKYFGLNKWVSNKITRFICTISLSAHSAGN